MLILFEKLRENMIAVVAASMVTFLGIMLYSARDMALQVFADTIDKIVAAEISASNSKIGSALDIRAHRLIDNDGLLRNAIEVIVQQEIDQRIRNAKSILSNGRLELTELNPDDGFNLYIPDKASVKLFIRTKSLGPDDKIDIIPYVRTTALRPIKEDGFYAIDLDDVVQAIKADRQKILGELSGNNSASMTAQYGHGFDDIYEFSFRVNPELLARAKISGVQIKYVAFVSPPYSQEVD